MSNIVTKIILFEKYMKYICVCQKKVVPLRDYLFVLTFLHAYT